MDKTYSLPIEILPKPIHLDLEPPQVSATFPAMSEILLRSSLEIQPNTLKWESANAEKTLPTAGIPACQHLQLRGHFRVVPGKTWLLRNQNFDLPKLFFWGSAGG